MPEFDPESKKLNCMRMKVLQQQKLTLVQAAEHDVQWMHQRLDHESSKFSATRVHRDETVPSGLIVTPD